MEKVAENLYRSPEKWKNAYAPVNIVQNLQLINNFYQKGFQEDAHEYLRSVLDKMKNAGEFADYVISNIFEGLLQNQKKCLECGRISTATESFMDMCLSIKGEHSNSVEQALKNEFNSVYLLGNENQYFCHNCEKKVDCETRTQIQSLPNTLKIQLKR
jgi:uncharacterized UBP type Zn finger protein